MSAPARLAGFAAMLALAFGAAVAAGDVIGPEGGDARGGGHTTTDREDHTVKTTAHGHESRSSQITQDRGAAHPVRGLAVAESGLRVVVDTPELRRSTPERVSFRIVDAAGDTVHDFDVEHEKRMHLIIARRDLTGFQHLHPRQQDDGSWSTRARIPAAGSYRLFADFARDGQSYTLAADLRVDGRADLQDLPESAPLADTGDGYVVRLDVDETRAGEPSELRFTAHKDGRAVHVEPYLGAGGHLVALREGDMAFLHVHPTDHGSDGGHDDSIGFEATFPTTGRYRLFLQFKHERRVHTAAFTQEVE